MSPYRVLVLSKNERKYVMSSALHKDKETGRRMILIQERLQGGVAGMRVLSDKDIAHRNAGSRNAHILAYYELVPADSGKKYDVIDKNVNNVDHGRVIHSNAYTIAEGMESAMHHYCRQNDLEVIQVL